MRIHTDSDITITLTGVDLSAWKYRVSIKSGDVELYKANADCVCSSTDCGCRIVAPLTVEETDRLKGRCSVQINYIDSAGKRHATGIIGFYVEENQDRGDL